MAVAPVPREARPFQGQRAGVVTRTAAAVVDALVVVAVLVVGYLAWAALRFMVLPGRFRLPEPSRVFSPTVALVVLALYLTVAWTVSGRTYGNLLMGLRVIGRSGRPLRLPGALLRAVACTIFPIGLFWCAVSRENSSLQDLVLRTSVVYDWRPRGARHPPAPHRTAA